MIKYTPEQFIAKIAASADAMSFGSGEPGVDIAGHTVSFLAANPEHIDRFMKEGNELWVDGTINFEQGCLSYRCNDEKIRTASEVRSERGKTQ